MRPRTTVPAMARATGTCRPGGRRAAARRLQPARGPERLPASRARVDDRDKSGVQERRTAADAIHLRRPGSQPAPVLVGSFLAAATIVRRRRGWRPGADYAIRLLDRVRHQPDHHGHRAEPAADRRQAGPE